jgi:magnesium transporter
VKPRLWSTPSKENQTGPGAVRTDAPGSLFLFIQSAKGQGWFSPSLLCPLALQIFPSNGIISGKKTSERGGLLVFYTISGEEIRKAKLEELRRGDGSINVGYLDLEELKLYRKVLGIDEAVITECEQDRTNFRTSVDAYEDYTFGIINIVNLMDVMKPRDRFAFIIKNDLLLVIQIVDQDGSSMDSFRAALGRFRHNATMEKVAFGILEKLLEGGNQALEETERQIIAMEQQVVEGDIDQELNRQIFDMRHRVSIVRNFYEQLVDIGEELQENENDIFPTDELRYLKIFTDKAQRLSMYTQTLNDSLVHLREALDAALNTSMNNTMKIFTMVSTIFLPLTLIAGWYGMNFYFMPELTWKYGYAGVWGLSILVVIICLAIFKWKKFW